jgi:hypothetical protein
MVVVATGHHTAAGRSIWYAAAPTRNLCHSFIHSERQRRNLPVSAGGRLARVSSSGTAPRLPRPAAHSLAARETVTTRRNSAPSPRKPCSRAPPFKDVRCSTWLLARVVVVLKS